MTSAQKTNGIARRLGLLWLVLVAALLAALPLAAAPPPQSKKKAPSAKQAAAPGAAKAEGAAKSDVQPQGAKAAISQAVVLANYRVGPGDVLHVNVWKENEITQDVAVRPDGFISLPLAKDVYVKGMTPPEIEKLVTERLSTVLAAPDVTVVLKQATSQKIYILGQVRRPGPLPMLAPMTVAQALSEAGGLTEYANGKKITIMRDVNGKQETHKFNYKDFVKGKSPQQNIALMPGDTINVP